MILEANWFLANRALGFVNLIPDCRFLISDAH